MTGRPRPCRAIEHQPCTQPSIYRAWLRDCPPCRHKYGSPCRGHHFCVGHAAELRAGARQHASDKTPVVVARMTGLTEAA